MLLCLSLVGPFLGAFVCTWAGTHGATRLPPAERAGLSQAGLLAMLQVICMQDAVAHVVHVAWQTWRSRRRLIPGCLSVASLQGECADSSTHRGAGLLLIHVARMAHSRWRRRLPQWLAFN